MQIVLTNGCDQRFIILCQKLDDYLNEIVGGEKQRQQYVQYNSLEEIHDVVLIMEKGVTVGCGSIRHYDDNTVEIKRVFVCDEYRGRTFGQIIMTELEMIARKAGYKKVILETGKLLKEAYRLYRGLGYQIIENYGPYADLTDSICMEKELF